VIRTDRALFRELRVRVHVLTPLFGIATGHMVLGEPIGVTFIAAIALVLVNRRR